MKKYDAGFDYKEALGRRIRENFIRRRDAAIMKEREEAARQERRNQLKTN